LIERGIRFWEFWFSWREREFNSLIIAIQRGSSWLGLFVYWEVSTFVNVNHARCYFCFALRRWCCQIPLGVGSMLMCCPTWHLRRLGLRIQRCCHVDFFLFLFLRIYPIIFSELRVLSVYFFNFYHIKAPD
jgi:hypothetical protein